MDDETLQLIDRLERGVERSRPFRILGFACLVFAGVMSFLAPSEVMRAEGSALLVYSMSVVWTVASAVCLVAAVRDRTFAEYVTIPFIAGALVVFTIALFGYGEQVDYRTWAYAGFFAAFASFLGSEWSQCRTWQHLEALLTRLGGLNDKESPA